MIKRRSTISVVGFAAVVFLSGCTVNHGGDTTCKDFNAQDQQKQTEAIAKMLKDEKGANGSNLEIAGSRLSAQTFCKTVGTPDSKISESFHL